MNRNETAHIMQSIQTIITQYNPNRVFEPGDVQQQHALFEAAFLDEYAQACLNSARDSYHIYGLPYPYSDAYLLAFAGWMAAHTNRQAAMPSTNGFGSHRDLPEGLCRWNVRGNDDIHDTDTPADAIEAAREFALAYRQHPLRQRS